MYVSTYTVQHKHIAYVPNYKNYTIIQVAQVYCAFSALLHRESLAWKKALQPNRSAIAQWSIFRHIQAYSSIFRLLPAKDGNLLSLTRKLDFCFAWKERKKKFCIISLFLKAFSLPAFFLGGNVLVGDCCYTLFICYSLS